MPIMGNVGAAMTSTHQVSGRAESLWGWARRQLSGDRNGVVRLLRRNRQRPQGDSPERTQAASGGVPSPPPDLGIDPRVVRDTLHAFVDPIDGHVKRVGRSSMPVIVRRQTENFRWLSVKVIDGSIQAVYQDRRDELHLVRIGEDGSLFPDGRVHVRQSWGQSTSLGAGAVDDLIKYKNPSPRRLLMPRTKWGDVRLDLSSAVPDGETASLSRSKLFGMMPLRAKPDRKGLRGTTAIEAAAVSETKRAKAVCNGWTPLVVASAMGQGATSIDKLMKGGRSGDYENRMVLAEYLQSLWGGAGGRYRP